MQPCRRKNAIGELQACLRLAAQDVSAQFPAPAPPLTLTPWIRKPKQTPSLKSPWSWCLSRASEKWLR